MVVVPPHEVDYESAPVLAAQLADALAAGAGTVRVDFAAVTFCDSSALSVLIGAVKLATASGQQLVVDNPTPRLLRLAEILSLSEFLGLRPAPPRS